MSIVQPTILLEKGKLGTYEVLYGESFWFRLKDEDGYTLFEMNIPLVKPLNKEQKGLAIRLAIAKFKLCETQK